MPSGTFSASAAGLHANRVPKRTKLRLWRSRFGVLQQATQAPASGKCSRRHLRVVSERQTTRVTARMPTAREATLLRMPRNAPVLITENTNIDAGGKVVEFGIACYPTPRVQILFEP